MTGSISGSGKWPFRPWHSMSVANTRKGARRDQGPSHGWLVNESKTTSISTSHRDALANVVEPPRTWYAPAGASIQLPPWMSLSIMNRNTNGTLDSYVCACHEPKSPPRETPSMRHFLSLGINVGSDT